MQAHRLLHSLPAVSTAAASTRQQAPVRQAVVLRAAAAAQPPGSPTSVSVSLGGPGRAAEARTESARDTSTSGLSASSESVKAFLESELPRIFTQGKLTEARYTPEFRFEDPLQKQSSFSAFKANLRLLRAVFNITFDVHQISEDGDSQVVSWWTMDLQPKLGLRRPHILVTGRSYYGWDSIDGRLNYQKDVWDSLQNNTHLSGEAVAYVLRSLFNLQITPDLETPRYTVLRKAPEYEIRRYEGYMVAETAMPANSGPAAGTGFQELASYIFGGNSRSESMEMTTPVISTAGQQGPGRMQFVMERKYGAEGQGLPEPRDQGITKKQEASAMVASITFSGLPLDFEVTAAERQLRAALLLDGLKPQEGYKLARYNSPVDLPPLRHNEVLINIEEPELFKL